jgi:hypothetical protein
LAIVSSSDATFAAISALNATNSACNVDTCIAAFSAADAVATCFERSLTTKHIQLRART